MNRPSSAPRILGLNPRIPLLALFVSFFSFMTLAAQGKPSETDAWPMSRGGSYNRGDAAPASDLTNTKARWEYVATAGISAEPVVADGVVYCHDKASIVHAVELATGKKIWSSKARVGKLASDKVKTDSLGDLTGIASTAVDSGCTHSAPLVAGDFLISATESGVLTAYRRQNGEVVWQRDFESEIFSSPRFFEGKVLFAALDTKYRAVDVKTGKDVWAYECGDFVGSTPAITKSGKAYVFSNDKRIHVVDCRTGKRKKLMEVGYRSLSHLCFAEAMLFFVASGRRFIAFDVIEGTTQWFVENPATSYIQSAVYRDGRVYVQMGPSLRCYQTQDGRKVWETPIGESGGYTPTIGKDCLYLRSQKGLRLFDLKTGKPTLRIPLPAPIFAPPVISGGRVIVTDANGVLRAF